jgi:hypothetical protein
MLQLASHFFACSEHVACLPLIKSLVRDLTSSIAAMTTNKYMVKVIFLGVIIYLIFQVVISHHGMHTRPGRPVIHAHTMTPNELLWKPRGTYNASSLRLRFATRYTHYQFILIFASTSVWKSGTWRSSSPAKDMLAQP